MSSAKTLRHSTYLESAHKTFLTTLKGHVDERISPSPYANYIDEDIDSSYLGVGLLLSDYTSLYAVYGEHMLGFDFDVAWKDAVRTMLSSEETIALVQEQVVDLNEKLDLNQLPSYITAARDANTIASSSFIVGKSCIEDSATKEKARVSLATFEGLLPSADTCTDAKANWEQDVARKYASMFKYYYEDKLKMDERNYGMAVRDARWAANVLDYEREGLAAFYPVTRAARDAELKGLSKGVMMVLGIATVAANTYMGFEIGATIGSYFGPWVTVIGGVIGAVVGFFIGLGTVFNWW